MEFVKMKRFLLRRRGWSSPARRYSLRAAQAKRKSFFFSHARSSSSPTSWLFYAGAAG